MATKIGEVQTEITADVNKKDTLKTVFRLHWGATTIDKAEIKPAADLKKGDKVKIIVEKL